MQEAKRARLYADGLLDSGSESDDSEAEELPASAAAAAVAASPGPAALAATAAGAAAAAGRAPAAARAQQSSGPAQVARLDVCLVFAVPLLHQRVSSFHLSCVGSVLAGLVAWFSYV